MCQAARLKSPGESILPYFDCQNCLSPVRSDREYAGLAAQHLATAGIRDVIKPICDLLRNSNFEEVDLIVSLWDSLNKLDAKLPQDLLQRFSTDETPWQIKTMCQDTNQYITT